MGKPREQSSFERMTQVATGKGVRLGSGDDPSIQAHPELWKWLATTEAGPDHLKDPARLSLKLVPGGVLVSLSDDAYGVSLDASCDTLLGALDAIEQALRSPQPAFRTWNRTEVKIRKKRKEEVAKS